MMKRQWLFVLALMLLVMGSAAAQSDKPKCDANPDPAGNLAFYIGQGQVYFARGNYAQAITTYSCALQVDASYVPAYISRGFAYAAQRDDARALEDYKQALELDPNAVQAYNNRGILYTNQGNFDPALADFNKAIELQPENAVAYHNRGVVYAAQGDYDSAIADFQKAIELNPKFPDPHAALGAVYLAKAKSSYDDYRKLSESAYDPTKGDAADTLDGLQKANGALSYQTWLPLLTPAK
jgi:tetratricopeptide (TPR) repeat protein